MELGVGLIDWLKKPSESSSKVIDSKYEGLSTVNEISYVSTNRE